MKWVVSRLKILKVLVVFFLFLQFLIFNLLPLQAEGIVPCTGLDCSTCHFIAMANNGIIWLFGIIFILFAILMTIAGFGLVTSGGNQSALAAAKSKFQNSLIGILIVMSAWLIIDTIMHTLLQGDGDLSVFNSGTYTGWGPWAQLECIPQEVPFNDKNTGDPPEQIPESIEPSACPVPPMTPIVDPLAIKMEKGESVIYTDETLRTCALKFVSLVGGGARVNSAYRPEAYQKHLYEIKERWCDKSLKTNTDSVCSPLKTAIGREVAKHFGSGWECGAVAKTSSRHSVGTAVDIGGISNHTDSKIKEKARDSCLEWANYPNDSWHYNLVPNCSCSP